MKNRRTCCETNSQKSAHRVRSLVCETNKFGDRDNSKVPASKRKCIYICTACEGTQTRKPWNCMTIRYKKQTIHYILLMPSSEQPI